MSHQNMRGLSPCSPPMSHVLTEEEIQEVLDKINNTRAFLGPDWVLTGSGALFVHLVANGQVPDFVPRDLDFVMYKERSGKRIEVLEADAPKYIGNFVRKQDCPNKSCTYTLPGSTESFDLTYVLRKVPTIRVTLSDGSELLVITVQELRKMYVDHEGSYLKINLCDALLQKTGEPCDALHREPGTAFQGRRLFF